MPTDQSVPAPPEMNRKSAWSKTRAFVGENRLFAATLFRHQKFFGEPEIKLGDLSPMAVLLEARGVSKGAFLWTIHSAAPSLTRRASNSTPEPRTLNPSVQKTGSIPETKRKRSGSAKHTFSRRKPTIQLPLQKKTH